MLTYVQINANKGIIKEDFNSQKDSHNRHTIVLQCYPTQFPIPEYAYIFVENDTEVFNISMKILQISNLNPYLIRIQEKNVETEFARLKGGVLITSFGCLGVCIVCDNAERAKELYATYLYTIPHMVTYVPKKQYTLRTQHESMYLTQSLSRLYTLGYKSDLCILYAIYRSEFDSLAESRKRKRTDKPEKRTKVVLTKDTILDQVARVAGGNEIASQLTAIFASMDRDFIAQKTETEKCSTDIKKVNTLLAASNKELLAAKSSLIQRETDSKVLEKNVSELEKNLDKVTSEFDTYVESTAIVVAKFKQSIADAELEINKLAESLKLSINSRDKAENEIDKITKASTAMATELDMYIRLLRSSDGSFTERDQHLKETPSVPIFVKFNSVIVINDALIKLLSATIVQINFINENIQELVMTD